MFSSDSTLGEDSELSQRISSVRLEHSVENIRDFTLRIQYEVLETLGLSDNWELSADFLIKFGKALRKIVDTYEEVSGERPTVYDIIWCLGCDLQIDPQQEVQILKRVA